MGSGKSSLAKKLGNSLNLPVFDLDKELEKQTQQTIAQIFEVKGEGCFRDLESSCLQNLIDANENFILACGGGTPCFNKNMELINHSGVSIFLDVAPEILYGRLKQQRKGRPLIAQMPDQELQSFVANLLQDRMNFYLLSKLHIKENNPTVKDVLSALNSLQVD